MRYYKTKEQIEGEAIGGLIGFVIRFIVFSMIYSPFVFAFGYTLYITQSHFSFHWLVSIILGLISASALFFIIGVTYAAQQDLKKSGNKIWLIFLLLNIALISGLPFFIGLSIGLDILGKNSASLLEMIIAGGFGGILLALPAYFGVIKNITVTNEQKA